MKKVFIIAEAGVNHNGKVAIAKKMIDVAAQAGADAIKFQTFKSEVVISRFAPKAEYQKRTTDKDESQLDMVRKLELTKDEHKQLIDYCRKKKIIFLSTPFDLPSIDLLNALGLKTLKIPSGEITNLPYLRKIGRLKKNLILSTGMSNINEVKKALWVLQKSGTKLNNITILHCNTAYPTPFADVNLRAMSLMKKLLKVRIGYSDHTLGIEVPIAAVALGAEVIEKHFTLNKKMKGPDHQASLDPEELKAMIKAIRNIENALGKERKSPSPSEAVNIDIARKSIVAARDIKKGETFFSENLTIKRPGNGINPMKWDMVIGKKAKRDFKEDELIKI